MATTTQMGEDYFSGIHADKPKDLNDSVGLDNRPMRRNCIGDSPTNNKTTEGEGIQHIGISISFD